MSSVFAGMGVRERTVRRGPENVMAVLGVQEWFRRDVVGERVRPKGSNVGVVRVSVLTSTLAVRVCKNCIGSLVPEYEDVAWLISSIVCHGVRPSEFLV